MGRKILTDWSFFLARSPLCGATAVLLQLIMKGFQADTEDFCRPRFVVAGGFEGFQDFNFIARYNTVGHPHSALAVTPFVSIGVPSNNYEFRGEAVVGRDLRELRFGTDATLRIDAISENLYLQGRYSYAFVERVLNIRNDRSNAKIEGDYLLAGKKMTLSGLVTGQRTHGGLLAREIINNQERLDQLDRLLSEPADR